MSNSLIWIKSSYSGSEGGQCVEVARLPGGGRAVRDSKDPAGGVLRFTSTAWREFIKKVRQERS